MYEGSHSVRIDLRSSPLVVDALIHLRTISCVDRISREFCERRNPTPGDLQNKFRLKIIVGLRYSLRLTPNPTYATLIILALKPAV